VLLFESAEGRDCGSVALEEGEGHKEGARRHLRDRHGLALLDVETTHILNREVPDSRSHSSAIAAVVRREKLRQGAGVGGVFVPIGELVDPGRGKKLSVAVVRDVPGLEHFLVPWVKTAGKNNSAC